MFPPHLPRTRCTLYVTRIYYMGRAFLAQGWCLAPRQGRWVLSPAVSLARAWHTAQPVEGCGRSCVQAWAWEEPYRMWGGQGDSSVSFTSCRLGKSRTRSRICLDYEPALPARTATAKNATPIHAHVETAAIKSSVCSVIGIERNQGFVVRFHHRKRPTLAIFNPFTN